MGSPRGWLVCVSLLVVFGTAAGLQAVPVEAAPQSSPSPVAIGTPGPVPAVPRAANVVQLHRDGQVVEVQPFARTQTADGRNAVAGRLIVAFQPGISDAERQQVHADVAQRG